MTELILPAHPLFDITLLTPRPDWREKANADGNTYAFVVDADSGLTRPATSQEVIELKNTLAQIIDVLRAC